MVFRIYKKAFAEMMKKPFRLWGITMLAVLFTWIGYILAGPVIGIGLGVAILFQAALANVYLKGYIGGEQVHVVDLFATFRDWKTIKRVICSIAWGGLWKCLWLLIPIVGPIFFIIKNYEYALIPYIVMDQPEVGITECKEKSTEMTKGYKGKMFLADILVPIAIFVVMLILGLLASIPYVGVLFVIIYVLVYIFLILFLPLFMNMVHASFYEEIKNPPAPPVQPQYGYPQYQQPAQPYQAPQQPQYQQPAQPYQAPQQPQYQQPAQPYQAPQQPQYQAPVQPTPPEQPKQ